jgi:hypothetical protein
MPPILKSRRMQAAEIRLGRDIREAIIEAVARRGSVLGAAAELGVPHSTLNLWIRDLGGTVETERVTRVQFEGFESPAEAVA